MAENYFPTREDIERFILEYQDSGGTNLAGQPQPGSYGYYTPDFSYGSYNIPATDPTYSSGYEYARTIAGGMPFEDVVAPGMSFSPEEPMGYTQADLRKKEIYGDFDGVMPAAPTQGTPLEASYETMEYAPVGTPAPELYVPGQTPFPGIPDFLRNLDFSNLPRLEDIQDIRGVENIRPSLLDVDVQEILKDVDTLKNIDTEKFADIDFSGINIPSVAPAMPPTPAIQQPITPVVQERTIPVMPKVPVMPRVPVIPEPVMQQPVRQEVPFVPEIPTIPMNFTGLPQMPAIPNIPVMPELPIVPQPIVPQPIQPMNFTRLSNLPVSNFVQPSVEDIVSPISRGRTLPPTPRGLFSL